ncbi:MAG: ABC transporter substrate-binding protein [Trueperaceae bacterium]|nr:ABC transporter substrate-binding protein [Trueperaceae bacterium]
MVSIRRRIPIILGSLLLLAAGAIAQAQQTTVRVAVGNVATELAMHRLALDVFMAENPDIKVELFETPGGGDRLGLFLQFFEAQSSEMDVLQTDVIWPGIIEEHLVDLMQHGAGDVLAQHYPGAIDNYILDGRLLAIPYQMGAGMFWYRTDLLEKYGYSGPPATWSEMEEMATVIMNGERAAGNPDMWGFVFQGNAYEGLTCNALEWIASMGGGTIIEADRTISINNQAAIDALEMAARWVGTISPTGVTGMVEGTSADVFLSGNAVFLRNWAFVYGSGQAEGSAIKDKFAVAALPSGEGEGARSTGTLGGQSFAVSRYSQNPEAAAKVALFLASFDAQKIRAVNGSFSGSASALYTDAEVLAANPHFARFDAAFEASIGRPTTVTGEQYTEVSRLFWTAAHDVLTGRRDAETALMLLELELQSLTGFATGQP